MFGAWASELVLGLGGLVLGYRFRGVRVGQIGLWVGDMQTLKSVVGSDMMGPDFLVRTNTLNLSGTCQD